MSYAPTQPVGGRVRFPQPSDSFGLQGNSSDFLTPTRQSAVVSSPFRTVLRRSAHVEPEPSVNPFTPRPDRSASPVGSQALARRNTTGLGTVSRSGNGTGYQSRMERTPGSRLSLARGSSREDVSISAHDDSTGGVGAWPTETYLRGGASTLGLGGSSGMAGDGTSITPFGRPRSPAPRSASPHKSTKKLPSFLLGSTQAVKSPTSATPYQPDSALTTASLTTSSMFGLSSAGSSVQMPLSSRPISPRVSRRLSGFGSNDMLSSAYKSSAMAATGRGASGVAASLEDAPPVMTLDDMDDDKHDVFLNGEHISNSAKVEDADPFATNADQFGGLQASNAPGDSANAAAGDKDYEDVKMRSVLVSGIPTESESSVLNQFRVYGEVLAFSVAPTEANSLAILYAEPWQAQRAIAQGGNAGRILVGNRTVVAVAWADVESTVALFKQVFPGRAEPESASQPCMKSFTLSQTIYAQSPRKRPHSLAQPLSGGSHVDKIRETEAARINRTISTNSPFRQKQFASMSGTGVREATGTSAPSSGAPMSVLKAQTAPRPRNGLLQSALDILFGW
ncbi:hypothetical protein IW140_000690 [Coemansia sp. RSA 1813]|nr:hypothetical protein EV178_000805 [Coemansia sp. RSA 1646]KAJ1773558.1 hypothetical protein LPJ74_000474 [Coemansia sp. RSA 1843]KAJ2092425.1 hypothetical protein IW138_001187 [Coemansia sp. RSA 986]KAJ2217351.1 hypothetical protein EV179_000501 [Coemansia sp. RSA 487]KAJ2572575.1 hypothetical protein IW140_000690 [Coemansia sp. RSA 1813]